MQELIMHACGHSQEHRTWGPDRVQAKQRIYYQQRHCSSCQDTRIPLAELLRPSEPPHPIPIREAYSCYACGIIQHRAPSDCVQCGGEVDAIGWKFVDPHARAAWLDRVSPRTIQPRQKPSRKPTDNMAGYLTALEWREIDERGNG